MHRLHRTGPIFALAAFVLVLALLFRHEIRDSSRTSPHLVVSAQDIANAPIGTIAVNFVPGRQFRFKFVGASRTGLRQVVLCSDGTREDRSFVFESEIERVESLVTPSHPLYEHALADCARELGR